MPGGARDGGQAQSSPLPARASQWQAGIKWEEVLLVSLRCPTACRGEIHSKNKKSRGLFGLPTALGIAKKWLSIHGQTSPKKEKIKPQPGLIVDHLCPSSLLSRVIFKIFKYIPRLCQEKICTLKAPLPTPAILAGQLGPPE
jgi:hypothetical protein